MYLIAPIVRRMDPEKASRFALAYYKFLGKIPLGRFISRLVHKNRPTGLQRELFGLNFYNPLGLGAGLDIHGDLYNDLNDLGFSFSEIGPMGSEGVKRAVRNLQQDPKNDILAVCIDRDWQTAFTLAYDFFDFFVLDLTAKPDRKIIDTILDTRFNNDHYKPVVVKIPEILTDEQLEDFADYCLMNGIDAIQARTLGQIKKIHDFSGGRMNIIANCRIKKPSQAQELLDAGASLIEVRTGFVYEGSSMVSKILKELENNAKNNARKTNQ